MSSPSRVRVYVATSLDGYLAGPDDDLSWLPSPEPTEAAAEGGDEGDGSANRAGAGDGDTDSGASAPAAVGFDEFFEAVGAVLMGRRTYDVVLGLGGEWLYRDRPVLVATHRPLEPGVPTVRPVSGDIGALVEEARQAAGGRDVYLDGGILIRQALDAGLVDDLILTIIPVVLGDGHPLFTGVAQRHRMRIVSHVDFGGGVVQLHVRPLGEE